jgi:NTE family protein
VVGAWLTIQPDGLAELPELMRARAKWHAGNAQYGQGDPSLMRRMAGLSGRDLDSARSIGRAAIAAFPPISSTEAETLWAEALPKGEWPSRLRAVAVDAGTGHAHAWSPRDGISLPVAVACSTAAPGVAPPVTVGDAVWIDGGVRSGTNADLVADLGGGTGRVLIAVPVLSPALALEERLLRDQGYDVRVIVADRFYQGMGDLLDPDLIDTAVSVGGAQARDLIHELA